MAIIINEGTNIFNILYLVKYWIFSADRKSQIHLL